MWCTMRGTQRKKERCVKGWVDGQGIKHIAICMVHVNACKPVACCVLRAARIKGMCIMIPPAPLANSRVSARRSPRWGGGETVAK